jgi:hypothetical protein
VHRDLLAGVLNLDRQILPSFVEVELAPDHVFPADKNDTKAQRSGSHNGAADLRFRAVITAHCIHCDRQHWRSAG